MSDPIISQVAQQAADQAAQQGASQSQGQVDAKDQAKFDEAMNQAPEQAEQSTPQNVDQAQHVNQADCDNSAPPPTLGDAILDGLEQMKHSHDTRAASIEEQFAASGAEPMSVQDCMKLQFEVMQLSLEQDMTGKIADKTSQGVQTLFRNQ